MSYRDGIFSAESGKWTRCWSNVCAGCSSRFLLALCLLFSLSFAYKLATIYASRLLQLHIYLYLALPISLNSLDREGARLLSPCGSQITITPDAGPDDSVPGDAFELKWEFDEDSQRYYVSFPDDQ